MKAFENIFVQKIKDQYLGVIYYCLGLFGYTWLMMSMYPSMKSTNVDAYLQQMPEEFTKFFAGSGGLEYSKFENFISMEYLSMFFVLIISFYLASSAGSAIAGNIEKKYADFDLSNPISRTNYASAQVSVTYMFSALLVIFNAIIIWGFAKIYDIDVKVSGLIAFTIVATFFMWALTSIAIFLSSILKSKLSVTLLTVAFTLGSFVFLSLSNIFDKLNDYKFLSIYKLYDPQTLLKTGDVKWREVLILAVIAIIGYLLSIAIFNKKDL